MSTSVDYWKDFFESAGLPMKIAANYAKIFVDQRIKKEHFPDIDKSLLREVGFTAVGDILAVLKQVEKVSHSPSIENHKLYLL